MFFTQEDVKSSGDKSYEYYDIQRHQPQKRHRKPLNHDSLKTTRIFWWRITICLLFDVWYRMPGSGQNASLILCSQAGRKWSFWLGVKFCFHLSTFCLFVLSLSFSEDKKKNPNQTPIFRGFYYKRLNFSEKKTTFIKFQVWDILKSIKEKIMKHRRQASVKHF